MILEIAGIVSTVEIRTSNRLTVLLSTHALLSFDERRTRVIHDLSTTYFKLQTYSFFLKFCLCYVTYVVRHVPANTEELSCTVKSEEVFASRGNQGHLLFRLATFKRECCSGNVWVEGQVVIVSKTKLRFHDDFD